LRRLSAEGNFHVFELNMKGIKLSLRRFVNHLIYLQLRTRRGKEKGRRSRFQRPWSNRGSPQWTIFATYF
jgi:hypothetical protein